MPFGLDRIGAAALHPRRIWRMLRQRWLVPAGFGAWRPLVPADAFTAAVQGAVTRLLRDNDPRSIGDYLEFGVSRGTSMACVYQVLKERGLTAPRLVGFDSFEGMPAGSDREGWKPGQYHSTQGATRRYLSGQGVDLGRVTLVKGWFSETCTPANREALKLARAGILMLDCDTYSSTVTALDFALPLIGTRAILIFDDWGSQEIKGEIGQKEAFQERIVAPGLFEVEELDTYYPGRAHVFHITRR